MARHGPLLVRIPSLALLAHGLGVVSPDAGEPMRLPILRALRLDGGNRGRSELERTVLMSADVAAKCLTWAIALALFALCVIGYL